jgi:hypothetical protein
MGSTQFIKDLERSGTMRERSIPLFPLKSFKLHQFNVPLLSSKSDPAFYKSSFDKLKNRFERVIK